MIKIIKDTKLNIYKLKKHLNDTFYELKYLIDCINL